MAEKRTIMQPCRLLFGLLLMLSLTSCQLANLEFLSPAEQQWLQKNEGKLEVLLRFDAPPEAYRDESDRNVGVMIDLLHEIESQLKMNFIFREFSNWSEMLEYSKTAQNFIVVGIAQTGARSKYLSFTEPLIKVPYVIVTRIGRELATMDDLIGSNVCTVENFAVNDYLAIYHPKIVPLGVTNDLEGLRAVSTGSCDAMLVSQMVITFLIQAQGITNLTIAGESGYLNRLSAATSINDPQLYKVLQKAVDQIDRDRVQEIYRRWVGTDGFKLSKSLLITLESVAGVIITLLVLLWAWTVILRRQVYSQTRELEQSKRQFEMAIQGAPIPMVIIDAEQKILLFNDKFTELFGYTIEDLSSVDAWWHVAYPDKVYRQRAKHAWQQATDPVAADSRELETEQWQFTTRDGAVRWVEFKMTLLGDFSIIAMNDITDHKLAEEALQESELRFRSIFSQTFQFAGIVALDGTLTAVNQTALNFIGASEADVVGKPFWDTPWWSHSEELQAWIRDAISRAVQGETIQREITHLTQQGEPHYFDFSLKPVVDENGKALYLVPESRDVTERRLAEKTLAESHRRLSALMSNLPGMAYRCHSDKEGTMTFVSEGCLALTGHPPADLVENRVVSYAQLVHPDDLERVEDHVQASLATDHFFEMDYRLLTAEGEEKWVWEHGSGVYGEEGELLALEGVILDVTKRKQAEDALRKSEVRHRQLIDNMSEGVTVFEAVEDGRDFVFTEFNRAGEQISGIARDQIIGHRVTEIFPRVEAQGYLEVFRRVWKSGQSEEYPSHLYQDQRITKWVENYIFKIPGGEIVTVYNDITERMKIEEEIHKLAQVVEQSPESIIITNLNADIEYVNEAFVRTTGYGRDEVMGKNPRLMRSGKTPPETYQSMWDALNHGRNWAGELYNRKKDGSDFIEFAIITPILQADEIGRAHV